MLNKELTQEQIDLIHDYLMDKYVGEQKEITFRMIEKACRHCPFSIITGDNMYDCAAGIFEAELPTEFEEIIKKDLK